MLQETLKCARRGSAIAIDTLKQNGVDTIFGVTGGPIIPLSEDLQESSIKFIHTRHEGGATFAAEGYARVSGKVGVVLVTSGPGASNAITGIADALYDSTPMLVISASMANQWDNQPFQGTRVDRMAKEAAKAVFTIEDADEVSTAISQALQIAKSGRPGPVFLSMTPKSQIQTTELPSIAIDSQSIDPKLTYHQSLDVLNGIQLLNEAKRPLILVGHGVRIGSAGSIIQRIAEYLNAPWAHTLLAKSVLPDKHPLNLGMMGGHGRLGANRAINEADVILAVGTRFAPRSRIVENPADFAPKAQIIRIDKDPGQLEQGPKATINIAQDAKIVLGEILKGLERRTKTDWISQQWLHQCNNFSIEDHEVETEALSGKTPQITIAEVFHQLTRNIFHHILERPTTLIVDASTSQIMAGRYFNATENEIMITTGGNGTLGIAVPAAIGAALADPDRRIIAAAGDYAFQQTGQELATITQYKIPVGIIINDNNNLRMVQDLSPRLSCEMINPDFVALAQSHGIAGMRVETREELEQALNWMLYNVDTYRKACVVHIKTSNTERIPRNNGFMYLN